MCVYQSLKPFSTLCDSFKFPKLDCFKFGRLATVACFVFFFVGVGFQSESTIKYKYCREFRTDFNISSIFVVTRPSLSHSTGTDVSKVSLLQYSVKGN